MRQSEILDGWMEDGLDGIAEWTFNMLCNYGMSPYDTEAECQDGEGSARRTRITIIVETGDDVI